MRVVFRQADNVSFCERHSKALLRRFCHTCIQTTEGIGVNCKCVSGSSTQSPGRLKHRFLPKSSPHDSLSFLACIPNSISHIRFVFFYPKNPPCPSLSQGTKTRAHYIDKDGPFVLPPSLESRGKRSERGPK